MSGSWSASARRGRPVTDSARSLASRPGVFICSLPLDRPATAGCVDAGSRFAKFHVGVTYIMHGSRVSPGAGRGPM